MNVCPALIHKTKESIMKLELNPYKEVLHYLFTYRNLQTKNTPKIFKKNDTRADDDRVTLPKRL